MEDSNEQIREMCRLWWDIRDIDKDQEKFRNNNGTAEDCWIWQLKQFLNTEYEYVDKFNQIQTFKIKDLDEFIKIRLIRQLGYEIGFFLRDFERIYYEYDMQNIK